MREPVPTTRGRRLRLLVIAAVLVLLVVAASVAVWVATTPPGVAASSEVTVLHVNGQPIPARELAVFVEQDRAHVIQQYQDRYRVNVDASFWTTRFGTTTPAESLTDAAVKDVVRVTVQQQLAAHLGVSSPFSYPAFLEGWRSRNEQRRSGAARGDVIYGPVTTSEADYFATTTSDLADLLEQKALATSQITVSMQTMQDYYDAHAGDLGNAESPSGSPTPRVGPAAPLPFSEVQAQVEKLCDDAAYDAWIDAAASRATVTRAPALHRMSVS